MNDLPDKGTERTRQAVEAQPDPVKLVNELDPTNIVGEYNIRCDLLYAVRAGAYLTEEYGFCDDLALKIGETLKPFVKVSTGYQMPGDARSAIPVINTDRMPRRVAVLTNGRDVLAVDDQLNEGLYVTIPGIDDVAYRAVLWGTVNVGPYRWAVYGIEDE